MIKLYDIYIKFVFPETESPNEDETKLRLVDHEYNMACSYVKDAALDVGIILKSEELIPGVLFNATERVLLQAGLCLAEDLIRKAQSNRIIEGKFEWVKKILIFYYIVN